MLATTLANIELPPIFSKVRLIAFALMTMLSLVGTTLLCVELFVREDVTVDSQRNIVLLLILINSFTSIMFPAMLLIQYTPLWEAVRLICLVFFQIGTSAIYTAWFSAFRCPDPVATCRRINMAILASVWVIPTLLLIYSGVLAAMVYWGWKHPEFQTVILREKRESELPMMSPPPEQLRVRSSAFAGLLEAGGGGAKPPAVPVLAPTRAVDIEKRISLQSAKSSSSQSSKLSKGRPKEFY
ncbi:uncharacterized protein B0H18DRAFT_977622 [Fomitopsis serialis]|uniref:uncharacterized protein n=1 Tax=Fomitopsis serialis TaxID=139415 RepID=UPI002007C727|nr:uncharacterized protein B0H18DRAFT_977622 [Neoantrodia serialis]KAH9934664.1 hypothetical protein B0H18DRAFT_977622 [Neoantrodia serialis]